MDHSPGELRSSLNRTEQLLATVGSCTRRLAWTDHWSSQAPEVLERLAQGTGAHRAYIYRNDRGPNDELVSSPVFEWTADGLRPHRRSRRMDRIPVVGAGFVRWATLMEAGEVVEGPVHRFPESERRMLRRRGIRSVLAAPLAAGGSWWGFLGLDDCRTERAWSAGEKDALLSVAAVLGAAIGREARALRDGDRVIGVHGTSRDITDDRRRDEHVRRTQRLASLGSLTSSVAHELNNPLTAIVGMAELLRDEPSLSAHHSVLDTLVREARRSSRIAADLRDLARKSHGEEAAPRELDLNETIRQALRLRHYAVQTNNIRLVSNLQEDLPAIQADQGLIMQVILNLLVNAQQAVEGLPMGRRIEVRSQWAGAAVVLEIRDNGPGIPLEQQDRLFDPFWTTRNANGSVGTGLSLCQRIVSEHGGSIQVESSAGEGTRFILRLPALTPRSPNGSEPRIAGEAPSERAGGSEPEGPHESVSDSAGEPHPEVEPGDPVIQTRHGPTPPLRLLVVDDEPGIRQLLQMHLSREGHLVVTAANGEEALRRIRQAPAPFDVILSDLRMPGMDGEELLRRILWNHPDAARHLVVMTGEVTAQEAERITSEARAAFLRKPFELNRVDLLLHRLVARG